MQDARSRLAVALAVSVALHLSLIFRVAVRTPAPLTSPVLARLQPEPPEKLTPPAEITKVSRTPLAAAAVEPRPPAPRPELALTAEPALERDGPVALPAPPLDTALPSVEMPLLADPTWYPAGQLDLYPRALEPVRPAYPEQAAQDGIGGEVTLLLSVDEHGAVQEAAVVQAAPAGHFEGVALAAFETARFAPAQKDGRSVRSRVLVRVSFDPREVGGKQSNLLPRRHEDTKKDETWE